RPQAGRRPGDPGEPRGPRVVPRPDVGQVRPEDEGRVRGVGRDEQLRKQAAQGRESVGQLASRAEGPSLCCERLKRETTRARGRASGCFWATPFWGGTASPSSGFKISTRR